MAPFWGLSIVAARRWTQSETGGLDPSTFALPELIEWPTLLQEPGTAWDATALTRPTFPHMWYIASPLPPLYVIPEEGRSFE